jgi:hypothetical protein
MKIALWFYNKRSFERRLLKEYRRILREEQVKEFEREREYDEAVSRCEDIVNVKPAVSPLKNYLDSRGKKEFDMETIRELMSYEMFI